MVEAGIRQRVLITAGAAGIGRAIAEAFVEQGAEIWVVDVDEASLATCPLTGTAVVWMSLMKQPCWLCFKNSIAHGVV